MFNIYESNIYVHEEIYRDTYPKYLRVGNEKWELHQISLRCSGVYLNNFILFRFIIQIQFYI